MSLGKFKWSTFADVQSADVRFSDTALSALQKPVFFIAVMGVNSVFALPFLQALYGADGVARYVAYDLANTILLYSWAYSIAVEANPNHQGKGMLRKRLLRSPPLYAVVAGLAVNFVDVRVPEGVTNTAAAFSHPTGFLVTLAVGIALQPTTQGLRAAVLTIGLRTAPALAVGLALVTAFGLTGTDRAAVVLFCLAPVAFSAATFASLENLDVEFATRTVALSLVLGILLSTLAALALA